MSPTLDDEGVPDLDPPAPGKEESEDPRAGRARESAR